MPLSEHEQRLLDQMEQALYNEDPKFVSRLNEDPQRTRHRKKLVVGALALLVGMGVVVLGVASQQIWLGAIGFVVMVAGGAYALAPGRSSKASLGTVEQNGEVRAHHPSGKGRKTSTSSASFMDKMEQRWEKRRRQGEGW